MSEQPQTRKASARTKKNSHRSTLSLQKTTILINVYDLLPPGKLATVLWTVGASLLHSAVVINDKEYAYGGHDRRGMTGVYWTRPRSEPPGGTFKCEILHGFTVSPRKEIENIIREASETFQGTSYNLLTRNCNHFTAYLCERLTGMPGPSWLNRAASIGLALPCVVPRQWVTPPKADTADGAPVNDDDSDDAYESTHMLGHAEASRERHSFDDGRSLMLEVLEDESTQSSLYTGSTRRSIKDTSGRDIHPAEIAPLPKP